MHNDTPSASSPGAFSGFLGKLRDVVFEQDAPENSTPAPPPAQAQPATQAAPDTVPNTNLASTAAPANPMTERMMDIAMSKTTAYTALCEALTPLEGFIADEGLRYQAAFSIVGKTRTVVQIVQAIDLQHTLSLDAEVQRFEEQASSQQDQEVHVRMREIESVRAQIKTNDHELAQLKKQIEQRMSALQTDNETRNIKITKLEQEVAGKREAIELKNRQFKEAIGIAKDRLVQAKAKVLRYLAA
jgi:hypothetical protein